MCGNGRADSSDNHASQLREKKERKRRRKKKKKKKKKKKNEEEDNRTNRNQTAVDKGADAIHEEEGRRKEGEEKEEEENNTNTVHSASPIAHVFENFIRNQVAPKAMHHDKQKHQEELRASFQQLWIEQGPCRMRNRGGAKFEGS